MTHSEEAKKPRPEDPRAEQPATPGEPAAPGPERGERAPAADQKSRRPGEPAAVVALGASAGGLAVLETFFDNMPVESGLAFVVVTHLLPDQASNMSELLQGHTAMPVVRIEDGMPLAPNRVYVIPPNHDLSLEQGRLRLLPRGSDRPPLTIDVFLRHLAEDQGPRAICVILSGAGADGALGLRAVSEKGGLVLVQDPQTTDYTGMPRSAIETGLVDAVLAPEAMPPALLQYVSQADFKVEIKRLDGETRDGLARVVSLLRNETGLDFSQYRTNTLYRRISKRMVVHRMTEIDDYLQLLRQDRAELDSLYQDILVGVTQFFREPPAFDLLRDRVLPALLQDRSKHRSLRVWTPGCSTGEEAYSLALLIEDYREKHMPGLKVDIFATDVNPAAIEKARTGRYPRSIAADVPAGYLARYFLEEDSTYRVKPEIREMMIFAEQDLLRDPPFSKLDLISCRNLLIYINPEAQQKALALFHYALNPGGVLWLGSSESLGELDDYFETIDRHWRLFRRLDGRRLIPRSLELFELPRPGLPGAKGGRPDPDAQPLPPHLLERSLLAHYEPVGVMINSNQEILYTYGQVDKYLRVAPGEARFDIMEMLRPGLNTGLAAAIRQVQAGREEKIRRRGVQVQTNGGEETVDFTIKRVAEAPGADLFLIIIEEVVPLEAAPQAADSLPPAVEGDAPEAIQAMQQELASTRLRLQDTIEALQVANEEHRSYAEELQSANEELQSTNEELTTSQEELQSINEELVTANAEIQNKNAELRRANDDLHNLLSATEIATIFLDTNLQIKRFTPAATNIFHLIETDRGRPLVHLVSNLTYQGLERDAQQVLDSLNTLEKEVETRSGQWYNMRIAPYRTVDNVIDGVVLTFAGIGPQKGTEANLRGARDYAQAIVDTLHEGVLILDSDLRVLSANQPFYRWFDLSSDRVEGRLLYELNDNAWDIPDLRRLLTEVLPQDRPVHNFELSHAFPSRGPTTLRLNATCLAPPAGGPDQILLAIDDLGREA